MSLSNNIIRDLVGGWEYSHSDHEEHSLIFSGEKDDGDDYQPEFSGNAVKLGIGEAMTPGNSGGRLQFFGRNGNSPDVHRGPVVSVAPGEFLFFVTEENFRLPPYVDAELFMNPRIANQGLLFFTLGHIAPGYSGRLTGTILNTTDAPKTLPREISLLYLKFSWVSDDPGASLSDLQDDDYDTEADFHPTHTEPADTFEAAREEVITHPQPGFALTAENFVTKQDLYQTLAILVSAFLLVIGLLQLLTGPTG